MGVGTNGTTVSHATHRIAIVSGCGNPESPCKRADRRPSGLWFTGRATYPISWPSLPRSKQATNVCQKIGRLHSMRNRRSQPSKLKVTDKVTDQWNSNHAQVYPDRLTGYDVRTRLTEFKTFALSNRVASDNRLQTAVARTSDTNRQHLRPLTRNHLKPQAKRFGRDDNTASVTDAQRVRFDTTRHFDQHCVQHG